MSIKTIKRWLGIKQYCTPEVNFYEEALPYLEKLAKRNNLSISNYGMEGIEGKPMHIAFNISRGRVKFYKEQR